MVEQRGRRAADRIERGGKQNSGVGGRRIASPTRVYAWLGLGRLWLKFQKICPIEYSPFIRNGASAEGASEKAEQAGGGLRCLRECMLSLVWAVPGSNFRENGPSVAKICPIEYSPFVRNGASADTTSQRSFPAIWRETIHRQKNFPPPKTQPFN